MLGFGILAISDFRVLANFGYAKFPAMSSVIITTFALLLATIITVDKGIKE